MEASNSEAIFLDEATLPAVRGWQENFWKSFVVPADWAFETDTLVKHRVLPPRPRR